MYSKEQRLPTIPTLHISWNVIAYFINRERIFPLTNGLCKWIISVTISRRKGADANLAKTDFCKILNLKFHFSILRQTEAFRAKTNCQISNYTETFLENEEKTDLLVQERVDQSIGEG